MKFAVFFLAALTGLAGCQQQEPVKHHREQKPAPASAPSGVDVDSAKVDMFGALPDAAESKSNPSTPEKTALGRMLFYDVRLSKDGDLSCNGCHDLSKYGMDGKDFSTGAKGKKLTRNTPSVSDTALASAQFWDARAESVEDAVKATLLDANMMGAPGEQIATTLKAIPAYADAFKRAFPDDANPVTFDNAVKALGVFTRKLLTPSKWDRFAKGEKTALSDDEKKGFLKFVEVGCPTCHLGPLVGGTMLQKLGKEKPWPDQKDKGRSEVTKSPSDDMMFEVPSLRNVAETAPYFHDASARSLEDAVKSMASYQLNKELGDEDVKSIATWLRTLTGSIPAEYQKPPELPAPAGKPAKGKH
jgi:cytochrome c peroxidase